MSTRDPRGRFLYELPPPVQWEFCRVMDGLSNLDWTRFASEVLRDQTAVRLAERRERRTDWVMNQWENRNGKVGELIDLLEHLQLLRPRDVILCWLNLISSSSSPPAQSPPSLSQFDDPSKSLDKQSILSTCKLSSSGNKGGQRPLPRPDPPPSSLQSKPAQAPPQHNSSSVGSGVMCWSYEEVHVGTKGFSSSLQVGEGGFGVVYRASLRNTDCAVKRLKQDFLQDWTVLKESFQTEVDKLSKFRHPNIVDLLGFSEGEGTVCLIYSYMENRSLEDQLHNEHAVLSWSQRVSVVEGASTALQFLHSPPDGHTPLIHGDVKSSNILLDRHLVPKLADFGLAQFVSCGSTGLSAGRTASVGKTTTVRGTLAYLPDEYVRNGELGTAVDVYSFGVVLLEVLTGHRALEKDKKLGERYLRDLVQELEDGPTGLSAAAWRKQLDLRLLTGGSVDPVGCLEMVALACRCLDKRKKRPAMTEVFEKLQDIHYMVKMTNLSSSSSLSHLPLPSTSHSLPYPPSSLDFSVIALSNQLCTLGPLEDTYQLSQSSQSAFFSLTPPHPLHSSSLPVSSSSSFFGPCETDESRGFSQYNLCSQFRFDETRSRIFFPSTKKLRYPAGQSQFSQPSVPTEDQYSFPPQPSDRSCSLPVVPKAGATTGLCGLPESLSPARSLKVASPGPPEAESDRHSGVNLNLCSVHMNHSKQRFLENMTLYEEGRILTTDLLSSDDLYGDRSSEESKGPEESDELDYLPAKHK